MSDPQRQRPPVSRPADESDLHQAGEITPKASDSQRWIVEARNNLEKAGRSHPWPYLPPALRWRSSPLDRFMELRELVGGGR